MGTPYVLYRPLYTEVHQLSLVAVDAAETLSEALQKLAHLLSAQPRVRWELHQVVSR